MLTVKLHAVELQIKLQASVFKNFTELFRKRIVVRDANAVRVEQKIIDAGIFLRPFEQFKKLRMQRRFADFNTFVTTGFLPVEFREAMHLDWDEQRQQRFDRLLSRMGRFERRLPRVVRNFPFNALLWDMRRRRRAGKPLV